MIVLFTDFGATGPYQGQLKAAIARADPAVPVIDLFCDAPMRDPRRSAYLLAAYAEAFPAGSVFVCVVDPGVGGPRAALWLEAGSRHFVGPDNGLLWRARAGAGAARRGTPGSCGGPEPIVGPTHTTGMGVCGQPYGALLQPTLWE